MEQTCERCGIYRWRAPGARVWNYGDGFSGKWTALDDPPPCVTFRDAA
jgi:hypothetical protein